MVIGPPRPQPKPRLALPSATALLAHISEDTFKRYAFCTCASALFGGEGGRSTVCITSLYSVRNFSFSFLCFSFSCSFD